MPWPFVGRTRELDVVRRTLTEPHGSVLMVLGEPGMGRSRLLTEALASTPLSPDTTVLRVEPAGPAPYAALAGLLSAGFAATTHGGLGDAGAIAAAAAELADRFSGRLVIVVDNAHRADHQTMLVLRHLCRTHDAVLIVTAVGTGLPPGPDPLDCLRYEPGGRTVRLPALSTDEVDRIIADALGGPVCATTAAALHAATAGSPGLLHGLVVRDRLADRLVVRDGMFQLAVDPTATGAADVGTPGAPHLVDAIDKAWRELALDRADELCQLASWYGLAGSVATTWAAVSLLRGRPADGLRVLTYAPESAPDAVLTRALLVGLGLQRIDDADALLVEAAHTHVAHRERLLAARAWLLAIMGPAARAARACASVTVGGPGQSSTDRVAAAFHRAAHAAVALAAERAHEAVSHLRRALAAADTIRAELPWFSPYLTACLIDALLLAGRINEATAQAAEFHAGHRGCGWNVAVAFDTLLTARRVLPVGSVVIDQWI